jgi:hypothetical protein
MCIRLHPKPQLQYWTISLTHVATTCTGKKDGKFHILFCDRTNSRLPFVLVYTAQGELNLWPGEDVNNFWTTEILEAAKKQTRKLEIPYVQDTHPAASTIRRSTRCQNSLTEPMSRMAMLRTSVQKASTRTLQTSWNSHSIQRQGNHLDRSVIVNEMCRWKHMFQLQSGVSYSCPGLFTC